MPERIHKTPEQLEADVFTLVYLVNGLSEAVNTIAGCALADTKVWVELQPVLENLRARSISLLQSFQPV